MLVVDYITLSHGGCRWGGPGVFPGSPDHGCRGTYSTACRTYEKLIQN